MDSCFTDALSTTCGILVAADILAVGVYVSFPYVCFWIGRYGSAEEETTACVLSVPGPPRILPLYRY